MQATDYLTVLNILIAFLGVIFVVFTLFEWNSLRALRKNFRALEKRIKAENHRSMKAAHRIIASYALKDIDARISLLESAIREFPEAFNGYNALGYAYLEKGEQAKAIDAFQKAVNVHPDDKAGYFDLGYVYSEIGQDDLAIKYFQAAVQVDPTAKEDIVKDARLKEILPHIL